MATTTTTAPMPRKKRRWLRRLILVFGVFVVLLVALYFVATSNAFFNEVILPRVSKSIGADVTVSKSSLHPFSSVELRDVKVQSRGQEPLITAQEVRARYSLIDIVRGKIDITEATINSPTINVVENSDGTSNLDALIKEKEKESKPHEKEAEKKSDKPAQFDIKKLALNNATIRKTKNHGGGLRDELVISNLKVTVENVRNGQTGKFAVSADVRMKTQPPSATNSLLEGKLAGQFSFALTSDAKPSAIQGETKLTVTRAEGALAELSVLDAIVRSDVTPSEIKEIALSFQKSGNQLGQIRASGPFDLAKSEGRLAVEVRSIDRQILNLIGATSGIDFGTTQINSTNTVEITHGGKMVAIAGKLDAAAVRIIRAGETTPELNATANYDTTVDLNAKTNLIQTLTFNSTQNKQPLLHAQLTAPMSFAWGNVTNTVGDSALNITLTNFNLANWKPFIGDLASSGRVSLQAKLLAQQGGAQLTFDLASRVANLTAQSGSNKIENANVTLTVRGTASQFNKFDLSDYRAELSRADEKLAIISGSGSYDKTNAIADFKVVAEAALASLTNAMPHSALEASAGALTLNGRVTQKSDSQTITGKLTLADFTGRFKDYKFQNFGTVADLDVSKNQNQIQIRKGAGLLTQSQNAGGSFDVAGNYNSDKKSGQFSVKLADFNENGLRPFLESLMQDKQLVSVTMNGDLAAGFAEGGDASVKGKVQVANLVVNDPKNSAPGKPLKANFVMDASVKNQIADVQQFQIGLSPTARAKNELTASGRIDMTRSNAFEGALKLAADSLDVTEYYNLFASDENAKTNAAAKPSPSPQTAPANEPRTEPEPINLPVANLSLDVNIARFYLREIEITNLLTSAKIQSNRVILKPQLAFNGAPVSASADLDLGVAGYRYDVSCNLQHVPLAPIFNSLDPQRKGQIGGTLEGRAQIKGAGVTDASIQKNLAAQFDFGSTNLNLAIPSLRNKQIKLLVTVIATLPELLRNRGAGIENLVSAVVQNPAAKGAGGLMDELMQSPINVVEVRGAVNAGKVDLERGFVQSAAFQAMATGDIRLAVPLTNSALNIPLSISLQRSLAEKIDFVPAGTPTNVAYVKLPDYVTEKGTIGEPKAKYNYAALAGTTLEQVSKRIKIGDEKTQSIIQGLGGILSGQQPAARAPGTSTTNAPTNRAQTNQPSALDVLDLFKKKKN